MVVAKTAVVIGRRKATTVGFREAAELASVEMQAQVLRQSVSGVQVAMTATNAQLMAAIATSDQLMVVTAMTAVQVVQSALHMVAMTAVLPAPSAHPMVAVTQNASTTATTVAVALVTVTARHATLTAQTAQLATSHAIHRSVAHEMQTQTRRLSSKTRFLSV